MTFRKNVYQKLHQQHFADTLIILTPNLEVEVMLLNFEFLNVLNSQDSQI